MIKKVKEKSNQALKEMTNNQKVKLGPEVVKKIVTKEGCQRRC